MSYATEVRLLVIWLVLAELLALALTVALMVRKPPPLTTQVDKTTGIKTHGLGWWLLTFSAACTSAPLLILAGRTALEAFDRLSPVVVGYWWVPLAGLAAGALAAGGWLLWRWEHAEGEPAVEEPAVLQADQTSAPTAPMWSLPPEARRWDGADRLAG